MKRKNPYTHLLEICKKYVDKIKHRRDYHSFSYCIDGIKKENSFSLTNLYHYSIIAEELGYDTVLKATKIGLEVHFIHKIPDTPYQLL